MASDISVRQWQELYRTGAFAQDDSDARELAGWDDFDDPLADRKVQDLAKLVMGMTHPFILDRYYVRRCWCRWFPCRAVWKRTRGLIAHFHPNR